MIATFIGNALCVLLAIAFMVLIVEGLVALLVKKGHEVVTFLAIAVGLVLAVVMLSRGFSLIGGFISAWS